MKLVIDLDETVVNFLDPVIEECRKNSINISRKDIVVYDMSKSGIKKEFWCREGFFENLAPFPCAVDVLRVLSVDHTIIIATDNKNLEWIKKEKQRWIENHIPFVDSAYFTSEKFKIDGDLIFDDSPHHLESFPGFSVKMRRDYNVDIKSDFSVNNWTEFLLFMILFNDIRGN